jgi:hypothetical protein
VGKYDPATSTAPDDENRPTESALRAGGKYAPSAVASPVPEPPPGANRTWGETLRGYGQAADDAVRAAANAVTFGMADRLAGAMPGTSTAEQVRLTEEARKRSPWLTTAGDVAGAVALPGMGGARLAARFGMGPAARAVGYGAEGAGIGAAQGAGQTYTGNAADYAKNALMGGVFGLGSGAVVGGAFGPRAPVSSARPPTLPEIRRGTDIAYDALRANPTRYDAGEFRAAADALEQRLLNAGYIRDYSPGAFAAVDRMRASQGQPNAIITPANIDLVRQGINRIPRSEQAAVDRSAGRVVKDTLDDFMVNPPAGAVLSNPQVAQQAAHTAQTAREMRAAQARMEMLANVRADAAFQAASTHSGRNVDNLIRQGVTQKFLKSNPAAQQRFGAYNPAERAALENVPDPQTWGVNALRTIGNMGAGGGGVGSTVLALGGGGAGAGYSYATGSDPKSGALAGLALTGGGIGARSLANRMGRGRIEAAEDLVARRNPLYTQRAANAPMVPSGGLSPGTTQTARDAITLQLLERAGDPRQLGLEE